jgi:hypothetical protein
VALLVLRRPLAPELLEQLVRTEAGMALWVKAVAGEQAVSAHILASPPMLLLQEAEALSMLETLLSTDSAHRLVPMRLTLAQQTLCLAAPVELVPPP